MVNDTKMFSLVNEKIKGSFEGVQLLRLFAALMVVFTHATFYMSTRVNEALEIWNAGAQGVPVFFVISGFVMTLTARPLLSKEGGTRYFVISRIIRIVPLYWVLNFLKIIIILLVPTLTLINPDLGNIILSLFFVFSRNEVGAIETFYGVGWTLNFEMFFYSIFALAIFLKLRFLPFVGGVLVIVSSLSLFRQDDWPAVTFIFHPLVLDFVWGILIAQLVQKQLSIPVVISSLLVFVGLIVIFLLPDIQIGGFQYAVLVGGIVFLEDKLKGRIPRIIILGGDASYSLYLLHPMVGVFVAIFFSKFNSVSSSLGIVTIVVTSLIVSVFSYRYFELPVTRYLKKRFLRRLPNVKQRITETEMPDMVAENASVEGRKH